MLLNYYFSSLPEWKLLFILQSVLSVYPKITQEILYIVTGARHFWQISMARSKSVTWATFVFHLKCGRDFW